MSGPLLRWLERDRVPADIYELLERHRLDPDVEELRTRVRSLNRELFPYQNHADPQVVRRAIRLLGELGNADGILSDESKRLDYELGQMQALAAEFRQEFGEGKSHSADAVRRWLSEAKDVHPRRLETVIAVLLSSTAPPRPKVAPVAIAAVVPPLPPVNAPPMEKSVPAVEDAEPEPAALPQRVAPVRAQTANPSWWSNVAIGNRLKAFSRPTSGRKPIGATGFGPDRALNLVAAVVAFTLLIGGVYYILSITLLQSPADSRLAEARSFEELGFTKYAISTYEKILREFPGTPQAQTALERLKAHGRDDQPFHLKPPGS